MIVLLMWPSGFWANLVAVTGECSKSHRRLVLGIVWPINQFQIQELVVETVFYFTFCLNYPFLWGELLIISAHRKSFRFKLKGVQIS